MQWKTVGKLLTGMSVCLAMQYLCAVKWEAFWRQQHWFNFNDSVTSCALSNNMRTCNISTHTHMGVVDGLLVTAQCGPRSNAIYVTKIRMFVTQSVSGICPRDLQFVRVTLPFTSQFTRTVTQFMWLRYILFVTQSVSGICPRDLQFVRVTLSFTSQFTQVN
jgi:hypothetical protein